MNDAEVTRHVEVLAAPNPIFGKPQPEDRNVLASKRHATASLMAAGYTCDAIATMVGTLCESRLNESRRLRKATT